jgi:hypothetical protein
MLPAVAHTDGARGTFWRSDVSLHNPHGFDLPVVVQLLPTGVENQQADTLRLTLYPYETVNLWDVLGPELFDFYGTGAMLVYADLDLACDPISDCQFLVTSRTYTVDPRGGDGEFGQTVAGADVDNGFDWGSYGYAAGILNDGGSFRCNFGVASWTADWTTVWVDVQDADGAVLATHELEVPPFGHVQQRLPTVVFGGSLVFYLAAGPEDAKLFGYASVADQITGDPSYLPGLSSPIGAAVAKQNDRAVDRPECPADSPIRVKVMRSDSPRQARQRTPSIQAPKTRNGGAGIRGQE